MTNAEFIEDKRSSIIGWLVRHLGLRREDAEDCIQQSWIKVRDISELTFPILLNASKQAAIDILRHKYYRSEISGELTLINCIDTHTVEDEVIFREALSTLTKTMPVTTNKILGGPTTLKSNAEKSKIHREREANYPSWIGRKMYILPPRCPKCKRLVEYNIKGENIPCKCLTELKTPGHDTAK